MNKEIDFLQNQKWIFIEEVLQKCVQIADLFMK